MSTCTSPLVAFYRRGSKGQPGVLHLSKNDCKFPLSWYEIINLPCGKCIGCRVGKSREWANRIMCESQMHEDSWFVTLTYENEHLPILPNGLQTLEKRDVQLFFKKVRKNVGQCRYYVSGEYGESTLRPHYHACIFGLSLRDLVPYKSTASGMLYNSDALAKCWGLGHVVVARLTWECAAYVARYTLKKVGGDSADAHYLGRLPEFSLMSRKPGIGGHWWEKFASDVFPSDQMVIDGRVYKPPRYFFEKYRLQDPEQADIIKTIRRESVVPLSDSRLGELQELAELKIKRLNETRVL